MRVCERDRARRARRVRSRTRCGRTKRAAVDGACPVEAATLLAKVIDRPEHASAALAVAGEAAGALVAAVGGAEDGDAVVSGRVDIIAPGKEEA